MGTISETYFAKISIKKKVKIYVITRIVEEQSEHMQYQSEKGMDILEETGVIVITETGNIHQKIAMIDRNISWEGSLNILSQKNSQEIMRRTESKELTMQIFKFLRCAR